MSVWLKSAAEQLFADVAAVDSDHADGWSAGCERSDEFLHFGASDVVLFGVPILLGWRSR